MNIYKIADLNIGVESKYDFTNKYMKDYLISDTKVDFTVKVTDEMREYEKSIAIEDIPEPYYELTAILRSICEIILDKYNGFFLHCSCLEYEGKAVIFTAKSGTGKSTHTRLWREILGDKVTMINDDKPIVRYLNREFIIYGTPWNGKHSLSNNIKAPIKAIYYLHQAEENRVVKCDPISSISKLLSQTILPDNTENMHSLLSMLERLVTDIPMFDLYCNISEDAVHTVLNSLNEI
ncbi:MAG: hypothetical protein IJ275_03145 [Ruminococcus sp.]|nr:hypothetical protein [Ruminococcus sp.]